MMDYARIAAACNAEKLKGMWKKEKSGERLGQWFMNRYAPNLTPDIFYETETKESLKHIADYLYHCHYLYELPPLASEREAVLAKEGKSSLANPPKH